MEGERWEAYRRLARAVLVQALRDVGTGRSEALRWFLDGRWCFWAELAGWYPAAVESELYAALLRLERARLLRALAALLVERVNGKDHA